MKKNLLFLLLFLSLCLILPLFAGNPVFAQSSGGAKTAVTQENRDASVDASAGSSESDDAEVLLEPVVISEMQVTVLPRDVFVGDAMEIRCTFSCDVALIPDGLLTVEITPVEIQNLTVDSITLQKAGSSYMISMLCVPWCVGFIDIPPFVISEHCDKNSASVSIDIPEINVKSIVNYTGVTELRSAKAPLLIPGTTWIIYLLSIMGIILLVVLVVILVRFRTFRKKARTIISSFVTIKNYHSLKHHMKKLTKSKKPITDKQFADIVSHMIREYISCRFSYNFRSETPAGVVQAFERISNGLFSVEAGEAIQMMSEVLLRCDYVRFAGDGGENGVISPEERAQICSNVTNAAVCLEKDERNAKV